MADRKAVIRNLKRTILLSSYEAKACHIGSALSCVEILYDLFWERMKENDIFLFTKASGVSAFYAVLNEKGLLSNPAEYLKLYPLPSTEVPGVLHSCGSVGMGLSVACGMAFADRTRNVYVLVSDGQLQEGVTYEAALFANQHKLNNLYVICDNNCLQAIGRTDEILKLDTAIQFFYMTFPNFENRQTTKGAGIPFMEDKYEWHYKNLTEEQLKEALTWT